MWCRLGLRPRVAVPSRIYFVVTLFALVVTLLSVPYTVAVLLCDDSATPSGIPCFEGPVTLGAKVFMSLASLFAMVFTVLSWRVLRASARRDATLRRERAHAAQVAQDAPNRAAARASERDGPPPGYH